MAPSNTNDTVESLPPFKDRVAVFLDPGKLILIAIQEFIKTIIQIIFEEKALFSLFSFKSLRARAFSNFWQALAAVPLPLKPGEIPAPLAGALSLLTPCLDQISGVVLELGPGTGHLTNRYPTNISAVYGAEPNEGLHAALRANTDATGLKGKYHILHCGAEPKSLIPGLEKAGLLKPGGGVEGVFDTILSIRAMCAIPQLEESLDVMYALLKPGGRLVVVEHVVNPYATDRRRGGAIGRLFQAIYKPLWSFFLQCRIDANTSRLLRDLARQDGGWEKVELKGLMEWSPLPWVGGVLVKKK